MTQAELHVARYHLRMRALEVLVESRTLLDDERAHRGVIADSSSREFKAATAQYWDAWVSVDKAEETYQKALALSPS